MRKITPYGDGLCILIKCENRSYYDWTSFISWYSIRQALPDAKVVVSCLRGHYETLRWCPRQRVPYFFHSKSQDPLGIARGRSLVKDPLLVLSTDVVALEPLPDDLIEHLEKQGVVDDLGGWCSAAHGDDVKPFCTIREGCGSFVPSKWIDRGGNPLGYADRFLKRGLAANERRIFTLWYKAAPLYENIG